MSGTNWLTYVADATDVIVALTSLGALIISFVALRRTRKAAKETRRFELRLVEIELRAAVDDLPRLLVQAKQEIDSAAQAAGGFGGSRHKLSVSDWKQDNERVLFIKNLLPPADIDYDALSSKDIENRLIETRMLQAEIQQLREKHGASSLRT